MDNFYEDGWLEQEYEDRFAFEQEDFGDALGYCEYCGEPWTHCFCEEEEYYEEG